MTCYPLIDSDAKGIHKHPMFSGNTQQMIQGRYQFYLAEEARNRYRLHAKTPHRMIDYHGFVIHCPKCSAVMKSIEPHKDQHELAIYGCPRCGKIH